MAKRWAAGVLLALILALPPLVRGRSSASQGPPPEEAAAQEDGAAEREVIPLEDGAVLVETASPASSLRDLRAVEAEGVPERDLDAARYALYRGLLDGEGRFDAPAVRGEAAAALYRLGGVLVQSDERPFADVPEEYQDAAAWARSAGVSAGVSEGRFAPLEPVSRGQLAAMLQRFAAWRDGTPQEGGALEWVLERGLYEGMPEPASYPGLPVSRLQLAGVLARLQRDRDPLAAALELPGEAESRSRQQHDALQTAIERAARRHGAVGVQAAVVEGGVVTDAYNYGWAVRETAPMTTGNKLRTASLSKVAVGLAAMLLREEGTVDLDGDISAYWGRDARNPRRPGDPVTIRSLLTHTSTIINNDSLSRRYSSVSALLGTPQGYGGGTPGDLNSWSYNNYAFGVLGQTLELASGRYLDDVLEERLLGPLDIDGSFAAGELDQPELVTPLYRGDGLARSAASVRSVGRWSAPGASGGQFAGGFTASARDMAKLTALLAGDGCFAGVRLMEAESVALMESCGPDPIPGMNAYQAMPLRFQEDLYGRDRLYYHTGSAYGVYNLLSYDPASGDGVVVLTMGADGRKDAYGIYAVCGEISAAVYDALKRPEAAS